MNRRPSHPVYQNEYERMQEAQLSSRHLLASPSDRTPPASGPRRGSTSNRNPETNPRTTGRASSALSSEVDGLRAQIARQAAQIHQQEQDRKALEAKYLKLKEQTDVFYNKNIGA